MWVKKDLDTTFWMKAILGSSKVLGKRLCGRGRGRRTSLEAESATGFGWHMATGMQGRTEAYDNHCEQREGDMTEVSPRLVNERHTELLRTPRQFPNDHTLSSWLPSWVDRQPTVSSFSRIETSEWDSERWCKIFQATQ